MRLEKVGSLRSPARAAAPPRVRGEGDDEQENEATEGEEEECGSFDAVELEQAFLGT